MCTKRVWATLVRLLARVDRTTARNNILYNMAYGPIYPVVRVTPSDNSWSQPAFMFTENDFWEIMYVHVHVHV